MTASERQNRVMPVSDVDLYSEGDIISIRGETYEVVKVSRPNHCIFVRSRPHYRTGLIILVTVFIVALVASVFLLARVS